MMQSESSRSGGYFDTSFDYRSLLPGGNNNNNSQQQQQQSSFFNNANSGSSDDLESGVSNSSYNDYCGGWLPEMTWKERILGCTTCMIAGYLLSLGSFFRIKDLLFGNPNPLVINATIGNIIALLGSCFLSGPTNQYNRMWSTKRRYATIMYLGSLVLTLIVASIPFRGPKGLLLLFLLLSQYISITWYCLSYIPMAQEIVSGYFKRSLFSRLNVGSGSDEF